MVLKGRLSSSNSTYAFAQTRSKIRGLLSTGGLAAAKVQQELER